MTAPNLTDYFTPSVAEEVIELLQRYGDKALIVAGGTFVHGLEARGLLAEVRALIDIQKLKLNGVTTSDDLVEIGATTTLSEVGASALIAQNPVYGGILDVLRYPPAQIKNTGTIGGCVCASAPLYDLPAVLLALDASVSARGASGQRVIALADFFTGLFENALSADEFVSEIQLPKSSGDTASAFLKLETNANDLAIINVAVRLTRDDDGRCHDTRVVIGGGVGETYQRATSVETKLNGAPATNTTFTVAAAAVTEDVEAISDHRGSASYRMHIAQVFIGRALALALQRLN